MSELEKEMAKDADTTLEEKSAQNYMTEANGQAGRYLRIPVYFDIFWLVATVVVYFVNVYAGLVMTVALAIAVCATIIIYFTLRPALSKRMVEFGACYNKVQQRMLGDLEIPYGLIAEDGKILWSNDRFLETIGERNIDGKNITDIFEEFKAEYLDFEDKRSEFKIKFGADTYRIVLREFLVKDSENQEIAIPNSGKLIAVYLFDETRITQLEKENKGEKAVVGNIYIDNYDEVLQSIEATRRTLLVALIDRRINKYFAQYDGIVRKLENDKYFVIFKAKYISRMQTNKFALLDEVKTVNIGNDLPVTVSIGIGMGGGGLEENYEFAGAAIDMALGRGGDQTVLKDGNKVYYYGGKTRSVEKNTKVKSRVRATAFRDLIETKENIYIMGHHIGDNDSFGASIGFYRIAKTIGKNVYIVLGDVSSSVLPLVESFKGMDAYGDGLFISGEEATKSITKNDALIIADCSRANYTEYPDLVKKAQCVLVFDHHRQAKDVIDNAQLSYIELSSSSTCEMVVEIMQYINETVKLTKAEAEAMYSGIMIDTNNFTNRTGVRTFEAAAYLKKSGIDITRVHGMFRDNLEDYKARAETVKNTEIYMDGYAIAKCLVSNVPSPTVVGAQAANELLNIKGVKASFVLTPYNDMIYISARSVDKVNVQLLMEEFGGGGHMNLAGAQVSGKGADEVIEDLKKVIRQKIEEGEI